MGKKVRSAHYIKIAKRVAKQQKTHPEIHKNFKPIFSQRLININWCQLTAWQPFYSVVCTNSIGIYILLQTSDVWRSQNVTQTCNARRLLFVCLPCFWFCWSRSHSVKGFDSRPPFVPFQLFTNSSYFYAQAIFAFWLILWWWFCIPRVYDNFMNQFGGMSEKFSYNTNPAGISFVLFEICLGWTTNFLVGKLTN